jgi:hypothetical protein
MFRSRQILSFFAFALLLILPTPLRAQESITHASVTGRVLDPSGAVVSHSTVTATELATNQTSTTETDDRGRFRFPYLSVGTYRITTQAVGFAETTRQVQLTVGAAFDLTLRVSMSQATANVQVTAEPPVIETDRSQIGETVSQTEAANLPLRDAIISTLRCCCQECLLRTLLAHRP